MTRVPPPGGNSTPSKGKPPSPGAKSANYFKQPDFDPRIARLTAPFMNGRSQLLKRGFMVWAPGTYPPGYSQPAVVGFLYNPSTVSASFVLQDSTAQSALQFPTPGDTAQLRIPLNQQVTFSILFDRTYEMGQPLGSPVGNSDLGLMGVDVDVRAMRQFTGMYVGDYSQQGFNNNNQTGVPGNSGVPTGIAGTVSQGTLMQMILAYLYFGEANSGIKYYGYVDSWNVTYTHFNLLMIPTRCEIDVSFTLLPLPVAGDTSTATGSFVTNQAPGPVITVNAPANAIAGR